jgi:hypothetical protein
MSRLCQRFLHGMLVMFKKKIDWMFSEVSTFDQSLNQWDVSSVERMEWIYHEATTNLSKPCVSGIVWSMRTL